jgi:hypothetical protein
MTKQEAWAAFAEQYNHRLHGPSDAFKFAWDAATKAEREAVLDLVNDYAKNNTDLRDAIRARGETNDRT